MTRSGRPAPICGGRLKMKRAYFAVGGLTLVSALALAAGCSSNNNSSNAGLGTGGGNTGGSGNVGNAGNTGGFGNFGATGGGGPLIDAGGGAGTGGGTSTCNAGPTEDYDKDGFTIQDGDCNDCEPNANPGAFDVMGNGVDEDCDGTPDNTVEHCDETIPDVGYTDPMAAAAAIGLCHVATASTTRSGACSRPSTCWRTAPRA